MSTPVRVRFCPSPTGSPHVGFARAALYNWVFARHHGGTFVFRIEDTDKERSTQESYDAMLETMRWLGLDWDEGPEVGGPYAPYRQSERTDLYTDALAKLAASSYTYDCFCTTEEVDARRKASGSKVQGYDGFCRELSAEQRAAFEAEGRRPVVRFRMPDGSVTWTDLVRGEITFETEFVPDFALCRANGDPLYTLVNPVDDALMRITHVLRGEDLLSSTPRQIPLHQALVELGISDAVPEFGHLPLIMGEGNKKLSKRDPQAHLFMYRDQGFLPEGLLNYLALLGWAIAADRDVFSLEEMVEAFDIKDVNPNPARFDSKKADAINSAQMRLLSVDEITDRVLPFLTRGRRRVRPAQRRRRAAARAGDAAGRRADQQAHRGRRDARLPLRRRGGVRRRPDGRGEAAERRRARRRRTRARRARGARRVVDRGDPGRAAGRAGRRRWASSRATPSGRSGWPSPAAGSRRRSSSRWSCSVASARWAGSRALWADMRRSAVCPTTSSSGAAGPACGDRSSASSLLVVCFVVVVPLLVQVPFAVGLALAGRDVVDGLDRLLDFDDPTPLGLAYLNISLACAIPVAWLLTRVLHGLRPGLAGLDRAPDPLALAAGLLRAGVRRAVRDAGRLGDGAVVRGRPADERSAQRVHQHDARLPARRTAAHAAAGGGGGVRVPRLPDPGLRQRLRQGLGRGAASRPCSSRSPTAARARRSSSTGSPSASWPASPSSSPAGSRPASRCTS